MFPKFRRKRRGQEDHARCGRPDFRWFGARPSTTKGVLLPPMVPCFLGLKKQAGSYRNIDRKNQEKRPPNILQYGDFEGHCTDVIWPDCC